MTTRIQEKKELTNQLTHLSVQMGIQNIQLSSGGRIYHIRIQNRRGEREGKHQSISSSIFLSIYVYYKVKKYVEVSMK